MYFIKKINEIDNSENRKKIVVFDDPINSNDSDMQYIIIEELKKFIKKTKKDSKIEKIIIMTHNHNFYLNIDRYKDAYTSNNFIHFRFDGEKSNIINIKNENEDFKSHYKSLWQDLEVIYKSEKASSQLLCNISRRIIETFMLFNNIEKEEFYKNNEIAKKIFNVNSHGLQDLEADLMTLDKESIINVMSECFNKNNYENHFEKYCFWKGKK